MGELPDFATYLNPRPRVAHCRYYYQQLTEIYPPEVRPRDGIVSGVPIFFQTGAVSLMRHDRAYWAEYRTQRTITMAPKFVFNFHGIGNPPPQIPTDERPFWLGEQQFKSVIDNIVRSNLASKIEITFDDGNSSDFDIALPRLQSAGLFAGFYVLAGRISKPGYLSAEQIHILTDSKMEIGLHGMDHLDWTRQDDDTMRREITEARRLVELAARKPVVSSALPFGRYNWRVMRRLRQEGFERIYTSDGAARMFTGPVRSRFSLRNNMRLENLIDIVEHSTSQVARLKAELRYRAKSSILLLK